MDKIIQVEIILNLLNTIFGRAICDKDTEVVKELSLLRHEIYYGDNFDYGLILKQLEDKEKVLKQYE